MSKTVQKLDEILDFLVTDLHENVVLIPGKIKHYEMLRAVTQPIRDLAAARASLVGQCARVHVNLDANAEEP